DDRPREKLCRLGPSGLGDNELLAVLIGTGTAGEDALALSNTLLEAAGGMHGLQRTSREELLRIRGMGAARAAQVLAAMELGRRVLRRGAERFQVVGPREAADYLMPEYGARPVEQFGALLLDTKHRVIRTALLSVGSQDATTVQPREVFRQALLASATAVLLFHNHPSGDPQPSPEDVSLTLRIAAAGDIIGVATIDHVILGDGRYYSLKESGLL
ncbi:MAG TPA: DNA repair protein RadC, partial [Vicinamibacterales bacterium]|nr:DNA repair protein RadC [Vicinamibacterales bacterium]